MNRLVVRLLVAFIVVIAVTGVSVVASLVLVLLLIGRSIPQATLERVANILQQALTRAQVTPTTEENYLLLGFTLGSLVVATVLAVLLARRIATPLEGVSKAASRVALGDWSVRAPIAKGDARGGSETARLVRDFNRMAGSLEALETERRATVAAIAHELRTPLTVLRGRLEAVKDGVLPATPDEYGVLIAQVELLSRLVADLRTLSLADAGQLSLQRADTDLGALVAAVAQGFQPRAQEKGVRLEVSVPAHAHFTVDAERIHQVVANLIENALRHTDAGFVRVGLEDGLGALTLRVRDSGTGIPEDALPRLFERFYRADSSRARASGGSGLGLSIARAIVTLHGGTIEARNHPEGGAEFTVRLPRNGAKLEPAVRQRVPHKPVKRVAPTPRDLETEGYIAPGSFTAALFHALSFPLALAYLIFGAVGFGLGLGLSVIGVGLLILMGMLSFVRSAVGLERWLMDALLGAVVRFPVHPARGRGLARLGWRLRDPATWCSLGYFAVKLPFALVSGVLLLAMGAVGAVSVLTPLLRVFSSRVTLNVFWWNVTTVEQAFVVSLLGAVILWLTFKLSDALAWLWVVFARWCLEGGTHSPPRESREALRLE